MSNDKDVDRGYDDFLATARASGWPRPGQYDPARDYFTVPNNHLWVMLLCMIRYSLGRASYAPGECVEYYGRYKAALQRWQKEQISREISHELQRHAESGRKDPFPCIGEWQTLVEAISKDIKETP